jgi:hypothetical protein
MPAAIPPSEQFRKIAESVKLTGERIHMTRSDFLAYFGVNRVGVRIKSQISYHLRRLQVTTEPDFRGKTVKEFDLIKATPKAQLQQVKPEQAEVDEIETEGGTIGELEMANRPPECIVREATSEVLFQKLVQSGSRGIVLVVKRIDLAKDDGRKGFQERLLPRDPIGIVTWDAYGRFFKQNGREPSVAEVLTRDIGQVHYADDIVSSMLRVDKKGVLVVVSSDNYVTGLLTRHDMMCELADNLMPYFIIGLIEEFLRMRVRSANINLARLREVAVDPKLESEDDLEFKGYENIFGNSGLFAKMKMNGTAGEMQKLLEHIREYRNDLMHFNQDEDKDYTRVLREAYDTLRKLALE